MITRGLYGLKFLYLWEISITSCLSILSTCPDHRHYRNVYENPSRPDLLNFRSVIF